MYNRRESRIGDSSLNIMKLEPGPTIPLLIGIFLFFLTLDLGIHLVMVKNQNKDHVCFRASDSNKDGMVTFQEF